MKRRLIELGILAAILGLIGLIVLVSGVFPVNASSGHWAVTRWILDYASDRSVAFYSRGIEVPSLDEPGMIPLGAATYESNCVFCHGQPGEDQPPVAKGMTPTPPILSSSVGEMSSQELFYTLKHGIKFAGMPAWPTQKRDDDIWPVVAFLHELPSMDNATYQELLGRTAEEDSDSPKIVSLVRKHCAVCHAVDGSKGVERRVPILAGQSETYLRNALIAYRAGKRISGVMMPIAHRLTDSGIDQLAAYFAGQEVAKNATTAEVSEREFQLGKELAENGDAADKIPSCVDCHGPGEMARDAEYPTLAGQPAWYLREQLKLFSKQHRGGSNNASLMHPIANKLSDKQIRSLAVFYERSNHEGASD